MLSLRGEIVNLVARKHNRSVYSAQALRHVAEQIEALYREGMASAERGVEGAMDGGATGADILRRGVDLADVKYFKDAFLALPRSRPQS